MNTPWRDDPRLAGKFHPDHPDDLQVLIHDGGPRFSQRPAEAMWVRVTGLVVDPAPPSPDRPAYAGTLLNAPHGLQTIRAGDPLIFISAAAAPHPIRVLPRYLGERGDWRVMPCDQCGFDELFDVPGDLMNRVFPDLPPDAMMEMFTAFCPLCGGVQVLVHKDYEIPNRDGGDDDDDVDVDVDVDPAFPSRAPPSKKWWQFWR